MSLVPTVLSSAMIVGEPAIVTPPTGIGSVLYVAAEALSPAACVVQIVPEVNAWLGAVPGAWIVCCAAPSTRISPGARLAQFAAEYWAPAAPLGELLVMWSTPPCGSGTAGSPAWSTWARARQHRSRSARLGFGWGRGSRRGRAG